MIELTIKEMLDAGPAITKVMKTEGLPVKVAYRFSKLQKQIIKEQKEFQEAQTKLYVAHGGKPVEQKESGMTLYHFEENTIQITLLGMKIYLHFSTQSRFLVQQLSTDLQQ